jgi:histidine triad (HIT) family protein
MSEIIKDKNCIFCKIVAGEIPSYKIFEDELVYAFLTIGPINEGHTLIIPKNHRTVFLELSKEENTRIFSLAQEIGNKINDIFKPQKVGLLIAGWDVLHTHIHVVPMDKYHDLTSEKTLNKTLPTFTKEEFSKTAELLKI